MEVPRVVMLDHTSAEGGAELAMMRLARRLRDEGSFDVRVVVFGDGPMVARLRACGVPAAIVPLDETVASVPRHGLAARGTVSRLVAALAFVPRLTRALRASGADLVVANSLKSAVFTALCAPLAGRRWVWHLHDRLAADYLPTRARMAMRILAVVGPRRIVVNSRATLATLPRVARRRAAVVYPGTDEALFARPRSVASPPVIGIVGRVSATKGQREFVHAAARVAPQHPSVRFRVVGDALFGEDGYADRVRAIAAEAAIGDRVDFTGWVADPVDLLADLAVLVHASPVPEPFGQVVVEAMALGVPVIATDAGGIPEIVRVEDGTALGSLVPPADAIALAAAIDDVLSQSARTEARAESARRAARRFSMSATAAGIEAEWRASLPRRRIR